MKPIEDKNFLDFFGKPLIVHQLELIKKAGFDDVILVGGEHNLKKLTEISVDLDMKIKVIKQHNLEIGMCGAILSAKDLIKKEPILVFSSNDVVELSAFESIKKAYETDDADSYILGKKVKEYFPGGYLEIDENSYIKSIVEKPEPGTEPSDLINLVIHIHKNTSKLIEHLEKANSNHDDLYELALDGMIKEGILMKAVDYDGFWQPIKYPWHIHKVFKYFFDKAEKKINKSAKISKNAIINGDVVICENVKIMDGAIINGPVYIGKESIIASNTLVRESYIGEKCVIGFSTEVARSYLGSDVWTHRNYIGDSVIGNNVSFGSGAVTGNFRLDEKNIFVDYEGKKIDTRTNKFGLITGDHVRVGINASVMPGVKIGSGSFIGAGIVVGQNIPENSFARGAWELKISENKEKTDASERESIRNKLKHK